MWLLCVTVHPFVSMPTETFWQCSFAHLWVPFGAKFRILAKRSPITEFLEMVLPTVVFVLAISILIKVAHSTLYFGFILKFTKTFERQSYRCKPCSLKCLSCQCILWCRLKEPVAMHCTIRLSARTVHSETVPDYINPALRAGFSRIKKIPYQAPPTQLGPQKCAFWKNAFLGPKYQC